MNCGKIIKDMKKWIHIFNDRWYCRKSGEEELTAEFGVKGWKQLPDAISRCYHFVPAKIEVEEHHIGVYACK